MVTALYSTKTVLCCLGRVSLCAGPSCTCARSIEYHIQDHQLIYPESHLHQLITVVGEALGQTVQQLADGPVGARREGVRVGAEGGGQTCACLQHAVVTVLLHDGAHLDQQQVQVLAETQGGRAGRHIERQTDR